MSLEDQYDAWVRSVTGTGRHSATKQDRDAAQNSLNAMQAQLDALAESQKRQKSAADALNTLMAWPTGCASRCWGRMPLWGRWSRRSAAPL